MTCPGLDIYPALKRDTTSRLLRDKQYIYDNSALWVVAPSQWLADKVRKSVLGTAPVTCIPNAVDTAVFSPKDAAEARQRLGIPEKALVLGGVAHGGILKNQWKGGKHLLEALDSLIKKYPDMMYLNIGGGQDAKTPGYIHSLPYVQDDEALAWAYAAMDIFLYPSMADNCPIVVIEALSCGVPVVAFATGGIPELIREGVDGLLVPQGDAGALAKAAGYLLDSPEIRVQYAQAARQGAQERFNLNLFFQRYLTLYRNSMEAHAERRLQCKRFEVRKLSPVVFSPDFAALEKQKPSRAPQHKTGTTFTGRIQSAFGNVGIWSMLAAHQFVRIYAKIRLAIKQRNRLSGKNEK